MEETRRRSELPEAWKTEFVNMRPLIPAIFQVVTAIAIIVTGCFGEVGIGTPWWSGSMVVKSEYLIIISRNIHFCCIENETKFFISGTSLLILLLMKQTVFWERCAFVTIILSTLIAVLAITLYSLEFTLATLPRSPFPHHGISATRLVLHYHLTTAELALTAFELGICSWIIHILQKSRKALAH
ncbi:hypothetical protein lerEdw1_012921 [Lerista edwardsae]|nr:hypothetical protein lerEdw1_012921 [Lerista edwardsae]